MGRHKSEETVQVPSVARSAVEQVDRDIAELRGLLKLRESVAVRAAYAFGDWPPKDAE